MYCDFLKTIPLGFAAPCYLGLQLMLFSICNFVQLLLTQTRRCTEGEKKKKEKTPQKPTTEPHRSVGTAEKNPRTFKNWERKFVAQNQRVHKCCQERPRTSCRKSLAAYSRLKGSPPPPTVYVVFAVCQQLEICLLLMPNWRCKRCWNCSHSSGALHKGTQHTWCCKLSTYNIHLRL